MIDLLRERLEPYGVSLAARLVAYEGTEPARVRSGLPIGAGSADTGCTVDGSRWRFALAPREAVGSGDPTDEGLGFVADASFSATVVNGHEDAAAVSLELAFSRWDERVFTVMPAALYAGNRFRVQRSPYSPIPEYFEPDPPTTISDVPRLTRGDGPSRVQLRAGDLAFPAAAFYFPETESAMVVLTSERTRKGWIGFDLQESDDRDAAWLRIMTPAMRERVKYRICDLSVPSDDVAASWSAGEEASFDISIAAGRCTDPVDLYRMLYRLRNRVLSQGALRHGLPFSEAFRLIETKYNGSAQWNEEDGYYGVGLRDVATQDWQVGWTGGGISSLPLLADGTALSRERAARTVDFMTGPGQERSGIYYGFHHKGRFYHSTDMWAERHLERGGSPDDELGRKLGEHRGGHLVRKSADAVYYLARHIALLHARSEPVPSRWTDSLRRGAEALATTWERHGQLGQFVNGTTLEIAIGGTTCGAMAPGALALASGLLGEERYARVAAAIGEAYYASFSRDGFTNGGPGDMLQNPDSESAYALLASLITLWETSGEPVWLTRAERVCWYALTWTMAYDFPFPPRSTFGRLAMGTTGSTFANTQNKHSSPGLCTLSGQSVFKLSRATGDRSLLRIVAGMTHNITQYLSRDDRPILARAADAYLPAGWMNERVETSDWLEPLGEVFYGPCWCEVSCMLTYTDIPGVYLQPDTGLVQVFDHVDAVFEPAGSGGTLRLTNPTAFPARVKLLVESSADARRPLGENYLADAPVLELSPGRTAEWSV